MTPHCFNATLLRFFIGKSHTFGTCFASCSSLKTSSSISWCTKQDCLTFALLISAYVWRSCLARIWSCCRISFYENKVWYAYKYNWNICCNCDLKYFIRQQRPFENISENVYHFAISGEKTHIEHWRNIEEVSIRYSASTSERCVEERYANPKMS